MTTRRKRLIFWVIFLISCTTLLILSSFALAIDPDSYEDDDTFSQANVIFLNNALPQRHNFHNAGDEDWIKFYGISEEIYEIKVSNLGASCNAVLELYDTDGTTLLKGPWNWGFEGENELMDWRCPQDGIYYVMVSNYDSEVFGEDTEYDLDVYRPVGPFPGFIEGAITDTFSGDPVEGAQIRTDGNASALSLADGNYLMVDKAGTYTITASATGYESKSYSEVIVPEAGAVTKNFELVPTNGGTGYLVTSDLWIRAVISTDEKGPIEAVWQKGGEDTTSRGDRVIWGHFYASPTDVTWGSSNNPDLFVKIWFDHGGRVDVNFFHVSVPDIEVYSNYPYDGVLDEQGTTTMERRYIRQYYEGGQSYSTEQTEDGNPPSGYSQTGNPSGYSTINDLRIGSIINTVEKGPIDAIWQLGGQDTTSRGDQVVWGHFYASPYDVTWGSQNNPDLFMKIWFDVSGRVDVNFFHVSVPDIEVYSALPSDGTYDQKGTTIMDNRYIRHEYWR